MLDRRVSGGCIRYGGHVRDLAALRPLPIARRCGVSQAAGIRRRSTRLPTAGRIAARIGPATAPAPSASTARVPVHRMRKSLISRPDKHLVMSP